MSHDNLPYIVEIHMVYGSDKRSTVDCVPWKNIENEIDNHGNINLFSPELMKLVPSTSDGEDCEVYAAKLVKKPSIRNDYIKYLIKEFKCRDYDEYCEKTKTPVPKFDKVFIFDSGSINKNINQIIDQGVGKDIRNKRENKVRIPKTYPLFGDSVKQVNTRKVSLTFKNNGKL